MSNDAGDAASAAAKQNSKDAQGALGAADSGLSDYMSNVNSAIAAGNPYESKSYLENQNLATSGAMNSEHDAADQALQQSVARTGGSSAAVAATEADNARTGQRDLTAYNAGRDTANEQAWQGEKQGLMRDQLAGADAYGNLYSTGLGGQTSDLKTQEDAQAAQDAMWGNIAGSAFTGAGAGLGAAFGKP